jgi:hypothetical protein
MSDTEQAEATAAEEQQATDGEAEAQASAGTENTEQAAEAKEEHTIPKGRFDTVIGERNTLREENQALHDRLEALEARAKGETKATETAEDAAAPPEHLSSQEKVRWYVEHYGKAFIERELDMDLGTAKTLLRSAKPAIDDNAERKWQNICEKYSLDPKNKDLGEYALAVSRLRGDKADLDQIMTKAAPLFGGKVPEKGNSKPKETPSASVEEPGVTGTMSGNPVTFRDAKKATEAAQKGVLAEHETIEQIIERRQRETKTGK